MIDAKISYTSYARNSIFVYIQSNLNYLILSRSDFVIFKKVCSMILLTEKYVLIFFKILILSKISDFTVNKRCAILYSISLMRKAMNTCRKPEMLKQLLSETALLFWFKIKDGGVNYTFLRSDWFIPASV